MSSFDYYTTLAKNLAAADLAKAAARRAIRVTRQALVRARYGLTSEQVLMAFGASSAEELRARALSDRGGFGWSEWAQRGRALSALSAIPLAKERALKRADDAVAQRFDVFGTEVSFEGKLIDWFLDPVSGHRYSLLPVEQLPLLVNGADPKYPWAIGRLDQLVALGQGHWIDGDPKYAAAFARQLSDFLRANPVGVGVQWSCPMEVALRGANLAQALLMFADAAVLDENDLLLKALVSLSAHADWVEQNLEDQGAVPNNHLVSNYVGLLVIGVLFPELPSSARQVSLAARGLREQMAAQVHPDGVSFEGSVPYHRLAVELFTLAYLNALAHGVDLGGAYHDRLERMYRVVAAYTSERGLAPQIGDNDSGRVFPLRDRASLDHGYLLPLGAAIFAAPELKAEGQLFSDEAAWLLGERGLRRYLRLEAKAKPGSFRSDASGLHVLRGAGATVAISSGANGQKGVGGHSHNDKTSFELHLGGVPVIVDPGSPTYTRDPQLRNAFRKTAAHNVLEIDGREQAAFDPKRLFALPDLAGAKVEAFESTDRCERISMSHRGLAPLAVSRTLTLDRAERGLSGVEVTSGEGVHTLVCRFHLPDTQARIRPVTAEERARAARILEAPERCGDSVVELGAEGAARALLMFEAGCEPALEASSYSPGYGELSEALSVVVSTRRAAEGRLGWVVVFL